MGSREMASPQQQAQRPPARAVLEFWLSDGLKLGWPSRDLGDLWFGGGAALDVDIASRFGPLVHESLAGGLTDWETQPLDRLALVILLDQFTRHVFRAKGLAFVGDLRAQSLVMDALAKGWDRSLPLVGQVFLTMPLQHAETMALQEESVRRFEDLADGRGTTADQGLAVQP